MGNRALATRSELSANLAALLSPEYELFAIEVSSGTPIGAAAELIGFTPTYGSILLERDDIRSRVQELLADRQAQGFPPKSWVEAQMVAQYRRVANLKADDPASEAVIKQATAAHAMLNNIAKIKGFIIDKSSKLTAKIDLSKVPQHQVVQAYAERLNQLSPGSRAKIEAITASAMQDGEEE